MRKSSTTEVATVYYQFADSLLLGENGYEAWRLQALTNFTKLPDYEETGTPLQPRIF